MADDKIVFGVDLDAAKFIGQGNKILEMLGSIGDPKQLAGLVQNLKTVGQVGAAAAAAFLAFKTTLSLVKEAEQIQTVTSQFETLGAQAGISTGILFDGLEKASKGLVDSTDLMKSANEAIVKFGSDAKKLPEIMDLTRKVTSVMGGEIINNFEAINNAIATGRTRQLKQLGIVVDLKDAYSKYAKEVGVAVGALSEEAKQRALMNAVLEKGNNVFKDTGKTTKAVTDETKRAAIAWKDAGEEFSKLVNDILGPSMKKMAEASTKTGTTLKQFFTDLRSDTKVSGDELQNRIERATKTVEIFQKKVDDWTPNSGIAKYVSENDLAAAKRRVSELEALSNKIDEEAAAKAKHAPRGEGVSEVRSEADIEKEKQLESKFQNDLLQIKLQRLEAEKITVNSIEEIDVIQKEEKLLKEQEFQNKIAAIKANDQFTDVQQKQIIVQLNQTHQEELIAQERAAYEERNKMLDNYVGNAEKANNQMARAAQVATQKATSYYKKGGKAGADTFNMLKGAAEDSLDAMAEGAGAMAKSMLKGIGKIATHHGKMMMLSAFDTWPAVRVPTLAAGVGLVALGTALGAAAGGGSSGGGGAEAAASSSSDSESKFAERTNAGVGDNNVQEYQQKKAVTVQIQGSYFETEQTKSKLLDMIRDATDATDFKYVQIGQR